MGRQNTTSHPFNQNRETTYIDVYILRWRTRTWDFDRCSIRSIHSAIAVSSPCRIQTRTESQIRGKALDRGSVQTPIPVVASIARVSVVRIPVARASVIRAAIILVSVISVSIALVVRSRSGSGLAISRRTGIVRSVIDRLLLQREGGRNDWAPLPRTVQVLKGDGGGGEPGQFVPFGIAGGEGHGYRRVIECLSGLNVRDQLLRLNRVSLGIQPRSALFQTYGNIHILRRRASTRDFDRLSVSSINRPVTISSSSRVNPSGEPECGCESRDSRIIRNTRLPPELHRCRESERGERE